jgi:SWI/SNF-related matrix-associated actin-dependent regulator 1 of chromatin subfamily A
MVSNIYQKTIRSAVLSKDKSGNAIIKITFAFNAEDLAKVRTLPNRKYNPNEKFWTTPATPEIVEKLKEWNYILSPELLQLIPPTIVKSVSEYKKLNIPGLQKELFPFQHQGVAFLESKRGRALIADEMGLGKTVQALAYLQLHPEQRPVLIIVPASLKLNWKREAETWMSAPNVEILSGSTPYSISGQIVIINYDIFHYWVDKLRKYPFTTMILDEVHYIKNSQAGRTKAVKKMGKSIAHIMALSGTPIVNRPIEAFNALQLINPTIIPDFWKYTQRYCGAKHNGFGWDFSGATNTQELHEILTGSVMIRRLKKDVLKELPDKIYTYIPIPLTNETVYRAAESDFIKYLKSTKGQEAADRASLAVSFTKGEALRQLAGEGKLEAAINWIEDFLEEDGKLVVFAIHRFVIDALMNKFYNKAVKVDGSVSLTERQRAVDRFQTDPDCRLFVGNVKAAGVGLTLTAASSVAFLELPWTPGDLSQAQDRCHRIGQKSAVNIYYLLVPDSVEERIALILDIKQEILSSVLDGRPAEMDTLLTELIKQY